MKKRKNSTCFIQQINQPMHFLQSFFGFLKKLVIFVLIVAIAVPLRYGSTNREYLQLRLLHSILSLKYSLIQDEARPTLSADYRAFEDIIRMRPILDYDSTLDPIIIIKNLRSSFTMVNVIPKPSQCHANKEVFEHDGHLVDTYWIDYRVKKFNKHSDKLLIYLHGGGYMFGDIEGYTGFECHLSELFNITILHVEYRLSPEHPLPSCVEDVVTVYRALLRQNISSSQLLIMGDSAGGGLSLLTIQALLAHQLPVSRGVILLSPWTDISMSGESHIRNRHTDVMIRSDNSSWELEQLLGPNHLELSANSPVFSPLFGSFEGFPPMYINVGTAEVLEDDSRGVVKKAQEAGVDVTFEEGLHMMHIYPIFFSYYPEARKTLNHINKWIQKIVTENQNQ